MKRRELLDARLFLEAAIDHYEEAKWIFWSKGICVSYQNSLLSFFPNQQGQLLQLDGVEQIVARDQHIFIKTTETVYRWDGETEPIVCQQQTGLHFDIGLRETGDIQTVYYEKFRYHLHRTKEHLLLPIDCYHPQFFPFSDSVFWKHWGKVYIWSRKNNSTDISCLEDFSEAYDELFALSNDWLCAVYERRLLLLHPSQPSQRFDNDQIYEVIVSAVGDCVRILLADGTLLEWNPSQEEEPEEIGFFEGAEAFLGERALLIDGDVCWF